RERRSVRAERGADAGTSRVNSFCGFAKGGDSRDVSAVRPLPRGGPRHRYAFLRTVAQIVWGHASRYGFAERACKSATIATFAHCPKAVHERRDARSRHPAEEYRPGPARRPASPAPAAARVAQAGTAGSGQACAVAGALRTV